jgi:hypothetical protein
LTSFNHLGFMKKKLAYVYYFGTPMGFVVLRNLDKAFATTWVLHDL